MRIVIDIPESNYAFFRQLVDMLPFAKVVRNYFAVQTATVNTWQELEASMGKDTNVRIPNIDALYESLPDYLKDDGTDTQ